MITSSRLSYCIAALCAFIAASGATAAAAPAAIAPAAVSVPDAARRETIAHARELPLGTTVTVRGTVTVPTNAFDGGFAIQQVHAGIYVLDSGGTDREIGQDIEVTGTLTDSSGLLAITPTTITAHGHGPHIVPKHTDTGDVGEATEGRLLKLSGTMVGDLFDDSPFGFKFNIDDGSGPIQIFLFPNVGIPTTGLVAGAKIRVTCFSNQFEDIFECDPPTSDDFDVHSR